LCQDLIKILYRKIQQQEQEDVDITSTSGISIDPPHLSTQTPPIAPVRSTPFSSPKSYAAPSWSLKSPSSVKAQTQFSSSSTSAHATIRSVASSAAKLPLSGGSFKGKIPPWINTETNTLNSNTSTATQPAWKKRVSTVSTSDYGKVGIQMGKTKVFLRHKAFEALERIRSTEQNRAATKLNAMFRRYLARIAYVPYRDAFRQELKERRRMFEHANEYKESKEEDFADDSPMKFTSRGYESMDGLTVAGMGMALPRFCYSNFQAESLVDKWTESQIRDAIRNPVPRHEWGKAVSHDQNFKWLISEEGLWIKNYNITNESTDGRFTRTEI
jgi:hypothetical protein